MHEHHKIDNIIKSGIQKLDPDESPRLDRISWQVRKIVVHHTIYALEISKSMVLTKRHSSQMEPMVGKTFETTFVSYLFGLK